MATYKFVLVRSGDGKEFEIGSGTLEEGTEIIRRLDEAFEANVIPSSKQLRDAFDAYEGCDIYAQLDGETKYMFSDEWEEWPY